MTRSLKNNKDLIQALQLQIKGAYDQLQNLQVASGLIREQVHVTQGLEATQNRSLNFNQQAKTRQSEAALIQTRPPKARSREQPAFNEVLVDDLNEMLGTQFGSCRELLTGGVKAA